MLLAVVRSRAWTEGFSSTLMTTTACFGRFKHSPTMSETFWANRGSVLAYQFHEINDAEVVETTIAAPALPALLG